MTREEKQEYLDSESFFEQLKTEVRRLGRPYHVHSIVGNYEEKIIRVYLRDPFFKNRTGSQLKTSLAIIAISQILNELKEGESLSYQLLEYTTRTVKMIYRNRASLSNDEATVSKENNALRSSIDRELQVVYNKHADKLISVEVDVYRIDDVQLPYTEGVVTIHIPDEYHLDEVTVPMYTSGSQKIIIVSKYDQEYYDINVANAQYVASKLPVVFPFGQTITEALLKSGNHITGHIVCDCLGSMFEIISVYDLQDDMKAMQAWNAAADKTDYIRADHFVCKDCGFIIRQVEWWENIRAVSYNQLVKNYMFLR